MLDVSIVLYLLPLIPILLFVLVVTRRRTRECYGIKGCPPSTSSLGLLQVLVLLHIL